MTCRLRLIGLRVGVAIENWLMARPHVDDWTRFVPMGCLVSDPFVTLHPRLAPRIG